MRTYLNHMLDAHRARDAAKTNEDFWTAQKAIKKWKFLYDEAEAEYKVQAFEQSEFVEGVSLLLAVEADILNRCLSMSQRPFNHPDGRQEFYVKGAALNGETYAARAPSLLEACLEVRRMLKEAGVTPWPLGQSDRLQDR